MNTPREIFEATDKWIKKNKKLVDLINEIGPFGIKEDEEKIQNIHHYHYAINQVPEKMRPYVFGEKVPTLKEIKKYMLDSIGNLGKDWKDDDDEEYESSGYAGKREIEDIRSFWRQLDSDRVLSIVMGSEMDEYEVNLDGHRHYLLSRSGVHPMLYGYIKFVLKMTPEAIEEGMHNSNDVEEELRMYDPPADLVLPTPAVCRGMLVRLTNKSNNKDIEDFDKALKDLVKRFDGKPSVQKTIDYIKEELL